MIGAAASTTHASRRTRFCLGIFPWNPGSVCTGSPASMLPIVCGRQFSRSAPLGNWRPYCDGSVSRELEKPALLVFKAGALFGKRVLTCASEQSFQSKQIEIGGPDIENGE